MQNPTLTRRVILLVVPFALLLALGSCGESDTGLRSENSPPSKAVINRLGGAPMDGSDKQSVTPVLAWTGSDIDGDPLEYDVYLGTGTTPPLISSGRDTRCMVPGVLDYSTLYYWHVVTRDDHDHTTVSDTWSFTTRHESLACSSSACLVTGWLPLTVDFTGTASEGMAPYHYFWKFGDDSTSLKQHPSHTYVNAGTYDAVLKITDADLTTCSRTITITVDGPPICSAFAAPTIGPPPLRVSFTGEVEFGSPPYSYHWTFGDGGSSTSQYPSYTYTSEGAYEAVLEVTDAQFRTCSKSININLGPPLSCGLRVNPASGYAPLRVSFTTTGTGGQPPYRFHIAFGDGGATTASNPTHLYNQPGTYTAVMTVSDARNATCARTIHIVARARP